VSCRSASTSLQSTAPAAQKHPRHLPCASGDQQTTRTTQFASSCAVVSVFCSAWRSSIASPNRCRCSVDRLLPPGATGPAESNFLRAGRSSALRSLPRCPPSATVAAAAPPPLPPPVDFPPLPLLDESDAATGAKVACTGVKGGDRSDEEDAEEGGSDVDDDGGGDDKDVAEGEETAEVAW
jgi:hypothetical protein